MGITPYDNQSSIGLFYRMRSFNGYYYQNQTHNSFPGGSLRNAHGGETGTNESEKKYSAKDYEEYRALEIRATYFIHKRIELNIIIPYLQNRSDIDLIQEKTQGIGDLNFYSGYHILRPDNTHTWQFRLVGGAGLKFPSGLYNQKKQDGTRYSIFMQTGTGSTDGFIYLNYVMGYRKLGINLNTTYKMNGENRYNEAIGNGLTAYLNLFYKFRIANNVLVIPSVQSYFEKTKGLYVNGYPQHGTSMEMVMSGPGIDFFYKNMALHATFQLPVYEKKETGRLGSAGKIMVGLAYNFQQKKYFIHH